MQKSQTPLRIIISTVQISALGITDNPSKVGYLRIFSVIRRLSPTRKSEKRVFYEIAIVPFTIALQLPGKQAADQLLDLILGL